MHQWSVLWNVLNTYTHPLMHVSTGDMHRMITVEGTRFVMVLSFTAGRAPRSTAGPGAGALDPNLVPEGQDFPQECCCQQVCSLCQQTAPPGALPQLLVSALSWPRAAEAVLSRPGDSQPCCPLGTDIPWGCSGAGTVMQAKPCWSACRAVCCGFRGGCSRCVDPSTSPGPANWDAAAARKSLELWALGVGARQSRALCQYRAQHSFPCQMGNWTAGEFLRLFTPVGYFCNQLYFMTVNTNCCGRAGRAWWHSQER